MPVITAAQRTEILSLVAILFGAAPGARHLTDLAEVVASGVGVADLAVLLADNPLFTDQLAGQVTTADQVDLLLDHLGLTDVTATAYTTAQEALAPRLEEEGADLGTLAYDCLTYLAAVADGSQRDQTALLFSDTATLLTNRVAVAEYYSVDLRGGADTLEDLQNVISGVTVESGSVDRVKAALDLAASSSQGGGDGEENLTVLITAPSATLDVGNWFWVNHMIVVGDLDATIANLAPGIILELQSSTTSVTVLQTGANGAGSNDDTLTLTLNGASGEITQTALTANSIETLTIRSTTSGAATNLITSLAADALSELIVTGNADLTITAFVDQVDRLTATSFTGDLSADFSTNSAGVLMTLGLGDDAVTVSGYADRITTGSGRDTIVFANGSSSTTTLVEITDFTPGAGGDVLRFAEDATFVTISTTTQSSLTNAINQAVAQLEANQVAVFIHGGSAYALYEEGTDEGVYNAAADVLVKLTGITGSGNFTADNFFVES